MKKNQFAMFRRLIAGATLSFILPAASFAQDLAPSEMLEEYLVNPEWDPKSEFAAIYAEAATLIDEERYADALILLQDLSILRPKEPTLWILIAHCRNGLGFWEGAYDAADIAIRLAPMNDYFFKERGIAAFQLGRNTNARADLEKYASVYPSSIEAHFYLGLIDMAENRNDQARIKLEKVRAMSLEMEPIVDVWLSELEIRTGDTAAASRRLNSIQPLFTEAGWSGEFRDPTKVDTTAPLSSKMPKDWWGYWSVAFEYDSNVISANDATALPGQISQSDDISFIINAGGGYRYALSEDSQLQAALLFSHRFYDVLDQFDGTELAPRLAYERWVDQQNHIAFTADFSQYWLDGDSYRTTYGLSPSWNHIWDNPNHRSSFQYNVRIADYQTASLAQLDRDGVYHQFAFSHSVRKGIAEFTVGTFVGADYTDGSEFDATYWGLNAALKISLTERLALTPRIYWTQYSFDESSVFSGLAAEREEDLIQPGIGINYRVPEYEGLTVFGDFSLIDNNSNTTAYEYDRNIYRVGASYQF